MAGTDRKSISGFRIDDAVEDAEFESIVPQGDRPRAMSSPVPASLEFDHLAILRMRTRSAAAPAWFSGPSYWLFVFIAAFSAFWISGGHVLFR